MTSSMGDADLIGLSYLRAEVVEAMAAYRRCADQERVAASEPAAFEQIAYADLLASGSIELQRIYDDFRRRWIDREIVGNWHEYRLSAIVMMKQVRNHVQNAQALRAGYLRLAA
ncbi:hypothetical protein [Sphingomonas sp. GB1N7]|uniref:hypothetical protein n=1 Tax=Parasphingomonas caseinilytica TaxID=3096158 RepID=UPI002FC69BB8